MDAAHAQRAVECETRFGLSGQGRSVCDEWAAHSDPVLRRFDDGTFVPNPQALRRGQVHEGLGKLARVVNEDASAVRRLRNEVDLLKRSMIEQVTAGLGEEHWNPHQRYLVDRLRGLRVTIEDTADCADDAYNASYKAGTNTLNLCPLLSHMPPEAFLSLIAHELGHLADPCNYIDRFPFGGPLRGGGGEAGQRQRLETALRRCLRGTPAPETEVFIRWATSPTRLQAQGFTVFAAESGANRVLTEKARECGLVSAPDVPAPRTYEGSPYLGVLTCVTRRYPRAAGPGVPGKPGAPAPSPVSSATPISMDGPVCDHDHSQVKECAADHIGTALLGFHLNRYPGRVPADRRDLLSYYYASVHCEERGEPSDQYPPSDARLRMVLQLPQIREAAGCRGSAGAAECEIPGSLLSGGGSSASPVSAPASRARGRR